MFKEFLIKDVNMIKVPSLMNSQLAKFVRVLKPMSMFFDTFQITRTKYSLKRILAKYSKYGLSTFN